MALSSKLYYLSISHGFQSNLRGMETQHVCSSTTSPTLFQSNLRGMETEYVIYRVELDNEFQSNLRGMETRFVVDIYEKVRYSFNQTLEGWKRYQHRLASYSLLTFQSNLRGKETLNRSQNEEAGQSVSIKP